MIAAVETAVDSGQSAQYFAWHPAPPFWNDYVGPLAGRGPMLDVGCGDGWIAEHVDDYTGIDGSAAAVERAHSLGRNVVQGSVEERLPFEDDTFGAVLLKDILEHVEDPGFTVREPLIVGTWMFCRVFKLDHRPRPFWWLAKLPWIKRNVMVIASRATTASSP